MRVGFIIMLMLALGALVTNYVLQDNGYVLINFRGYRIEMSVPVLVFLLVLGYAGLRLLVRIWGAPRRLGEAVARRRAHKAGERITQGYIELGQGNFARGEKLLTRGARNSETPLLNYLAAARAAQAQGDAGRRDSWLDMAAEQEPRARPTVLLTRAQLQLDNDEQEAALATLEELLAESPRNTEALRLKAELALARDDWPTLEQALPALRRSGKMPAALLDDWTVRSWAALLRQAGDDGRRGKTLWKQVPGHLRSEPDLVVARAEQLSASGAGRKAAALLRKTLQSDWDDRLVLAYGELAEPPAADRLHTVEKWLGERPDDPVVLLVAARLCMATELWGKARSYYESSVALRPAPQTWHELGRLLLQLGEHQHAFDAFQQGLTQSYGAGPVPMLTAASLDD